jgi:hypothetical protein
MKHPIEFVIFLIALGLFIWLARASIDHVAPASYSIKESNAIGDLIQPPHKHWSKRERAEAMLKLYGSN